MPVFFKSVFGFFPFFWSFPSQTVEEPEKKSRAFAVDPSEVPKGNVIPALSVKKGTGGPEMIQAACGCSVPLEREGHCTSTTAAKMIAQPIRFSSE